MEDLRISCIKPNLTDSQRQAIYHLLLQESLNGTLKKGLVTLIARMFGVSPRTVSRVWHQAQDQVSNGLTVNLSSKMPKLVRPKRLQIDFSHISEIPLCRRTNIRSLANLVGVSKSTMHRRIKEGALRPHTNAIKPALTDENKTTRLKFCLSMVTPSLSGTTPKFTDMFDVIHIDEKWFYMSKPTKRYYLLLGEEEPLRTCKSKFITKVMFLAAVARPRFDTSGNEIFSGKIGILPFTTLEPAKCSSKNRVAGTMETKPILSVTKDVTRSWLIHKVLPAIRAKWPQDHTGPIFIQQDNAKPHIDVNDVEFLEEASRDGFDIRLRFQPLNSPDVNLLDLGFFRAIQSLQEQEVLRNIDELVSAVERSFKRMSSHELNNVFLTLQTCMKEIMEVHGSNNYKTPHIGKARLERQGNLPLQVDCDENVINQIVAYLSR